MLHTLPPSLPFSSLPPLPPGAAVFIPVLSASKHMRQFLASPPSSHPFSTLPLPPGAAVFIPVLSTSKHMRQFRLSARGLSKAVGGAITEILKGNNPTKKRVLKKKK